MYSYGTRYQFNTHVVPAAAGSGRCTGRPPPCPGPLSQSSAVTVRVLGDPFQLYLIAMVWSCYRYLLLRQGGAGAGGVSGAEPEPVPSLPDYEAALTDPRFSKVDLASYPTPPPSYAAATSDTARGSK